MSKTHKKATLAHHKLIRNVVSRVMSLPLQQETPALKASPELPDRVASPVPTVCPVSVDMMEILAEQVGDLFLINIHSKASSTVQTS